jgi:hypothetical protein
MNDLPEAALPAEPISCSLHAFDAEQETRYRALKQTLRATMQEVREMENGFAFVFPADASVCLAAMEFATLERLCCPFLTFQLELSPKSGPLTLVLSGPPGAKEILAEALLESS